MKHFFKMAQGASALHDLQKKYPSLSVAEIISALKRSKGDPGKAMQLLTPLLSSGGGATVGSAPDLRQSPEAWFKYYDRDNTGLERHEVAAAISETFTGTQRDNLMNAVESKWRTFDPDGSGSISLQEFLQPRGLRDTLVASLNGARISTTASATATAAPAAACSGPSCRNGCGRKPYKDYPTCCTHCRGPAGPHARSCDASMATASAGRPSVSRRCPKGHPLTDYITPTAGSCDGCGARVGAGQHVMDCRSCNWYLCDTCTNRASASATAGRPSAGFRPSARRGQRKALLIGINYVGQKAQLKGCVNDVTNMKKLLTEVFQWDASCIRTLTDGQATYRNILSELDRLAAGAQPGDALFFHFSGHGAQQEDPHGYEEDGMNETIIPVDFKSAGMITDDQLLEKLVAPLPEGARLTAVMDCCHSGTGLDLPFCHTGREWKCEVNPFFCACDAQLFSGCEDHATSADVQTKYSAPGGAMTSALCEELRRNPRPSYTDLITSLNITMKRKGFKQRPQLSSSQAFQFPRQFSLTDATPNTNTRLGRVATHKFKPNPRPYADGDPLAEMLGPLAGLLVMGAEAVGGKKAKMGFELLRVALAAIPREPSK